MYQTSGEKRNAPERTFTTDRDELLNDPEINVIVEVINETEPAFQIVTTALKNGKDVVSASKKMLAEHLAALLDLQKETGHSLLYEAAACASIPVIRNLEEYYDNDLLHSLRAIVNGSTNFILTKMFEEKLDFKQALLLAQQLGFAESDPSPDIEGVDAVNKWALLLAHAYGIVADPRNIVFNGIQHIQAGDATVAAEKHYEIKLVGQAKKLLNGKVAAFVLPQFVKSDDHLSFVKNEYNGVVIESGFADKQFFYGKGPAVFPLLPQYSVIYPPSAISTGSEYKKLYHHAPLDLTDEFYVKAYISFDDWDFIPKDKFEMDRRMARRKRPQIPDRRTLHLKNCNNGWWRENKTSLILTPDPIIERSWKSGS